MNLTELVIAAGELGREAVSSTFHTDVLARLLGWDGDRPATVALEVDSGVANYVAHGLTAEVVLVRTGQSEIAEVELQPLVKRVQPYIDGDDRFQIELPPDMVSRPCDVDSAI